MELMDFDLWGGRSIFSCADDTSGIRRHQGSVREEQRVWQRALPLVRLVSECVAFVVRVLCVRRLHVKSVL